MTELTMVQNTNPRMIKITPQTDAQIPQPRLLDTAIVERRNKEGGEEEVWGADWPL